MDLELLGKKVVEVSYIKGDFILSSGRKSNYIFDKYAFETRPEILKSIASEIGKVVTSDTTKIAGMELGGIPLATALSLKTNIPFVIVRKAKKGHGLERLIEGDLSSKDKVLIIEDIATTGSQALLAAKTVEETGASILKIVYVVDREEGAREEIESKGYQFGSLFTKSSLGIT